MTVQDTDYGHLQVTEQALKTVVGKIATSQYGVVAMSSRNEVKDHLNALLKKHQYDRGIEIINHPDSNHHNHLTINMFVVIAYGINVSAIASSVQKEVATQLRAMFNITPKNINLVVTDIATPSHKSAKKSK